MKINTNKLIERVILSVAVGSISVGATFVFVFNGNKEANHISSSENIAQAENTVKDANTSNSGFSINSSDNKDSNNGSYNNNNNRYVSKSGTQNINPRTTNRPQNTNINKIENRINCHDNEKTICNNVGPVDMSGN